VDIPGDVLHLQELAVTKGTDLGHHVGGWELTDEGGASGWRATCSYCGAVVYIRREHGLSGIAGQLTVDRCPHAVRAIS